MKIRTLFINLPTDLRPGEVRACRIIGLDTGDAVVYLDGDDAVTRVRRGAVELDHVPWDVQQVLADTLDPHCAAVE